MNAYDMLVLARAKIANPNNWTQGTPAANAFGKNVCACDPSAVKWCSYGACVAAVGDIPDFNWYKPLEAAVKELGFTGTVVSFNDTSTHTEVLALFDKAIELAADIPKERL